MCILYPCGIPLLFAMLMRRERQRKMGKVRGVESPVCAWLSNTPASQGEDFLDSYIGFVAAGYSVNVRAVVQCQAIPSLVTDFL